MTTSRVLLIGFVLLVLGIMALPGFFRWYNSEYFMLVEQCKQLKLGDSEREVIRMLGTRYSSGLDDWKGRKVRYFLYAAPGIVATAPSLLIDVQLDQVVSITCDDGYHIQVQDLK